ncbi:TPA: hypothetical protein RG395_002084 [Legionella pneumophila]|nr:hypothetical protein [Legionella pneumophila]HBD7249275.1 hypothetical protein [Legionella pneumophila]HBD9271889.1 hypothetical protein [Legionella pneumophila]HCJ1146775.1 hypothetical protein [Legionella pneumophila]HCQ3576920.1 hypothetical protein [Legionella pneumophila]
MPFFFLFYFVATFP